MEKSWKNAFEEKLEEFDKKKIIKNIKIFLFSTKFLFIFTQLIYKNKNLNFLRQKLNCFLLIHRIQLLFLLHFHSIQVNSFCFGQPKIGDEQICCSQWDNRQIGTDGPEVVQEDELENFKILYFILKINFLIFVKFKNVK